MKNMFKYDLYTHTKEGNFNTTASVYDLIRILDEKGYDGLLITDHNSYKGYKFYEENMKGLFKGISIIKGIEYDTKDAGKVIIIIPSNTDPKIFTSPGLALRQTIDIVHDYKGIIGLSYPYQLFLNKYKNTPIINELDFVEGLKNEKTKDLPLIKGSDNRSFKSIGRNYTYLEQKINNEDELIAYIKTKKEIITDENKRKYLIKNKFIFTCFYAIFNFLQTIIYFPKRMILLRKLKKTYQ